MFNSECFSVPLLPKWESTFKLRDGLLEINYFALWEMKGCGAPLSMHTPLAYGEEFQPCLS